MSVAACERRLAVLIQKHAELFLADDLPLEVVLQAAANAAMMARLAEKLQLSRDLRINASELYVRMERKMGLCLPKGRGGDRKSNSAKSNHQDSGLIGADRSQESRWQRCRTLRDIADEPFDAAIQAARVEAEKNTDRAVISRPPQQLLRRLVSTPCHLTQVPVPTTTSGLIQTKIHV